MTTQTPLVKTSEVRQMVLGTVKAFESDRRKLMKALRAIQWRFRGPNGEFVGLTSAVKCAFVPESEAYVFDGRDNELYKLTTYESHLGPLTIEVIKPCEC